MPIDAHLFICFVSKYKVGHFVYKKNAMTLYASLYAFLGYFVKKMNGSFTLIIQNSREKQQVSVSVCLKYLCPPPPEIQMEVSWRRLFPPDGGVLAPALPD